MYFFCYQQRKLWLSFCCDAPFSLSNSIEHFPCFDFNFPANNADLKQIIAFSSFPYNPKNPINRGSDNINSNAPLSGVE